ncbi:MAG: RNA polymerase sigma factor [Ignavibacteriales bacterium]|nr:MAG: RNA polymerase sigma factor [Ignavibacteriales bacterium]
MYKSEKENIPIADVFKLYAEDIFRYSYSILRNAYEARDAVQEVFLKYAESKNIFREECSIKTWLFTITRNYCYDITRKKKHSAEKIQEDFLLPVNNPDYENLISLKEAMKELTPDQNEIIYLRDYEGYSYKEIAELTGQSLENVKIKLFRAKQSLRKILLEG